ncbi:hypothetical protein DB42_BP00320 [Neochlamydia sp. EPS4]|uniref:hypothetical protein n=1 Tax=Neochlamydia sp. EPS4 TaxID=1478175 RepID=UPI00058320F7|nr:hypothetical protein [Neochlamydia sp. EPS4]KIC73851.1 hypothetical protein DB42_BP00320 [Neochlamydia sp. EPS4]
MTAHSCRVKLALDVSEDERTFINLNVEFIYLLLNIQATKKDLKKYPYQKDNLPTLHGVIGILAK